MSDKIEAQGKTVQDAVNEALLRMGARQNEVKVTVVDEPKAGFLGLGGRQAKVLVEKKQGRRGGSGRRDYRENDENYTPHALNEDNKGGGGRRGRRPEKSGSQKNEGSDNRQSRGRRVEKPRGQKNEATDNRQGRGHRAEKAPDQKNEGSDNRQSRSRRSRRPSGQERQERQESQNRQEASGDNRRQESRRNNRPQGEHPANRTESRGGRQVGSREQRSRRSRRNQDGNQGWMPDVDGNRQDNGPEKQQMDVNRENRRPDGRQRGRRPAPRTQDRPAAAVDTSSRSSQNSPAHENDRRPVKSPPSQDIPDVGIVAGVQAVAYAKPLRDVPADESGTMLENLTNDVLARAGFPCRASVTPDEYFQVKVSTDDSSAGMLIGRHGATIDALEHLIDRMAGMAAGDRVRMNLDINNYRLRRSEVLCQRVIEAVAKVNEGGRPFHMEPMCARERRIVHLAAENEKSVKTFTMSGSSEKHVVIAPADRPLVEKETELPEEVINEEATVDSASPDHVEDGLSLPTEELPELDGYTGVVEAAEVTGEPDDFGEDEFKNQPHPES